MKLYVKPKLNFELLGTSIKLNNKKWYRAYIADNIPSNDSVTRYWVRDLLLRDDEVMIKVTKENP